MTYKVTYFDSRGIAEPIRMIFAYAGVEFEDFRIPVDLTKIGVPNANVIPIEIKEKCNWGQLPLVEFDGKKLVQSLAITRFLAKKFNLVPKDDFEAALCDEYVDASRDMLFSFMPAVMEKDETKKAESLGTIRKTADARFFSKFESIVAQNGGQKLVGQNLTWADIYVAYAITQLEMVTKLEILKDYPGLKKYTDSVFAVPQLKAWIAKRPVTMF